MKNLEVYIQSFNLFQYWNACCSDNRRRVQYRVQKSSTVVSDRWWSNPDRWWSNPDGISVFCLPKLLF